MGQGLNFHDFDWLLEKDKPHGLKPLTHDDMGMAIRGTEGHDELLQQHAKIHDFDSWTGKRSKIGGAELEPITDLKIGVRADYE